MDTNNRFENALVHFTECKKADLDKVGYSLGQIIYTSDTNELYIDYQSGRLRRQISDIVVKDNETDILSIVEPVNTLYFAIDTLTLWTHITGTWIKLNEFQGALKLEIDEIRETLRNKVDKAEGKSLLSNELIEKLIGLHNYEETIQGQQNIEQISKNYTSIVEIQAELNGAKNIIDNNSNDINSLKETVKTQRDDIDDHESRLQDIEGTSQESSNELEKLIQTVNNDSATLQSHSERLTQLETNSGRNTERIEVLEDTVSIQGNELLNLNKVINMIIDGVEWSEFE